MILRCALFLLFLSCARTKELSIQGIVRGSDSDFSRFSLWPSLHNGASLHRVRRESVPPAGVPGPSEGSVAAKPQSTEHTPSSTTVTPAPKVDKNVTKETNAENSQIKQSQTPKASGNAAGEVVSTATTQVGNETAKVNATNTEKPAEHQELNPGVVKRGMIVFGGFAVMAIAYFVFYRTKNKINSTNDSHGASDANQFRYGVLQSDDRRDNMELSRVPLTMESDEDEDEDLEIFDLEQKKKSLSYVNLQATDEDIVLSPRDRQNDRDNLLLDIEDGNADTLINWSNNGSKSIL